MIAFEISINGKRVCLAGASGCVYGTLHWSRFVVSEGHCQLRVGGRQYGQPKGGDYFEWAVPSIGLGDEVTIRIVEAESADPPALTDPHPTRPVSPRTG